jgi:oligopeptide transport system substrate-binding protein
MRHAARKLTLVLQWMLIAPLALISVGCAGMSAIRPLPDSQQVIRLPIVAEGVDIHTMDPATLADYFSYVPITMTFPGLLTQDASGNAIPWAATGMPKFDPTTNTYTFTLRAGLKWSDGTPIDASTFAYSLNRSLSPCIGSPVSYYLFAIKDAEAFYTENCGADKTISGRISSLIGDSITAPDTSTLDITLGSPAPYFLEAMTYPTAFAQPEQLINQYGSHGWTSHLIDHGGFGGNLFKVKLWDHFGNLHLIRNDSFWGARIKLSEVDFKIYQSIDAEYADYLDGRLDQGYPSTDQYKASKVRSDFHERPLLQIDYFQVNWTKSPFNDIRARQAFELALNKEALANKVNQGSVSATNHIVPAGMPGYDPALTGPDGTESLSGDIDEARALMHSYAADHCGGQLSKCPLVTLVGGDDPSSVTINQAVEAMWQDAFPGYPIHLSFLGAKLLDPVLYGSSPPQIFVAGWIDDYPDPQDWLSLQFGPGAVNNLGSVLVPAANALMARADTDLGPDRMSLYHQAEQLLVDQVAWIPLDQAKVFYTVPAYVHNFALDSQGVMTLGTWQQVFLSAH